MSVPIDWSARRDPRSRSACTATTAPSVLTSTWPAVVSAGGDADEAWSELAVPEDLSGTGGGNPSILDLPMLAPFTNLPVADRLFVDAVLDGCPAEATFEDGWRAQQVVGAAVASQLQRGWVSISSWLTPSVSATCG